MNDAAAIPEAGSFNVDFHGLQVKILIACGIKILLHSEWNICGNVQLTGSGIELARRLCNENKDVTAVVATADILAIGAMKGFYEQGVSVPNDISIVGFDDLEISKYLTPGLTTVRQEISQKGEKAVELLLDNIQDADMTKREVIIPVSLSRRESVRDMRGEE